MAASRESVIFSRLQKGNWVFNRSKKRESKENVENIYWVIQMLREEPGQKYIWLQNMKKFCMFLLGIHLGIVNLMVICREEKYLDGNLRKRQWFPLDVWTDSIFKTSRKDEMQQALKNALIYFKWWVLKVIEEDFFTFFCCSHIKKKNLKNFKIQIKKKKMIFFISFPFFQLFFFSAQIQNVFFFTKKRKCFWI